MRRSNLRSTLTVSCPVVRLFRKRKRIISLIEYLDGMGMIEEEGNSSDEERPSTSVVVDRGSRQYGEPKHILHRQAVRSRIAKGQGG